VSRAEPTSAGPDVPAAAGRSYGPIALRAGALVLAGVISQYEGDPRRATGFVVLAVLLTAVSLAWPSFSRWLDRVGLVVGRLVAGFFLRFAVGLVDLGVNVPGRLLVRLSGRDPLSGLTSRDGSAWREVSATPSTATLPYAVDIPTAPQGGIRRTRTRQLASWTGWACVLLVLNTLLGTTYADIAPPTWTSDRYYERAIILNPTDLPPPAEKVSPGYEKRMNSPAMRPYPWRKQFFDEYTSLRYHYEPYITMRVRDTSGRYVNVKGGVRRSWEPPTAAGADLPTVWFLGGSTTFGEDQRDLFTIPSMVARRAAAEGHPIKVVNMGVQGFTNFQEVLTLEQMLATLPKPDLVVFYDGANDLDVQTEYPSDQPTHFPYSLALNLPRPSLYDQWSATSLVHLAWHRMASVFGAVPAGAATGQPNPEQVARNTLAIYTRGLALAQFLVARHHTKLLTFWQPARYFDGNRSATLVEQHLPKSVIDVSDALDGVRQDLIYADPVHTNERGARIVAARLWRSIEPAVR